MFVHPKTMVELDMKKLSNIQPGCILLRERIWYLLPYKFVKWLYELGREKIPATRREHPQHSTSPLKMTTLKEV